MMFGNWALARPGTQTVRGWVRGCVGCWASLIFTVCLSKVILTVFSSECCQLHHDPPLEHPKHPSSGVVGVASITEDLQVCQLPISSMFSVRFGGIQGPLALLGPRVGVSTQTAQDRVD